MLILAFDTSAAACSVALWRSGDVMAARRLTMEQGHGEALIPLIEAVMAEARIGYTALDRIAVTVGPGSFTGVRVGLAAARGLGLAAGKPVVGLTTTEVLAASVPAAQRAKAEAPVHVLAAIDTKRGDLYVQKFDARLLPQSEACVLAPAELPDWTGPGEVLIAGDGGAAAVAALAPRARPAGDALPDPALLAAMAAARLPSAAAASPVYIRPPDAAVPYRGGRLRP